jgi:hypothetical protein
MTGACRTGRATVQAGRLGHGPAPRVEADLFEGGRVCGPLLEPPSRGGLTQSAQSTDLRTYEPRSSRVEMYSVVQSSPVAPTALFDCAT